MLHDTGSVKYGEVEPGPPFLMQLNAPSKSSLLTLKDIDAGRVSLPLNVLKSVRPKVEAKQPSSVRGNKGLTSW